MGSIEPLAVTIRLSEMFIVWSPEGPQKLFVLEDEAVLYCSRHKEHSYIKMEVEA